MTVSHRHAAAVAALALLAGLGVWTAWLSPARHDPCATPDLLRVTGLIPGTPPTPQRLDRLNDDTIQWSEGALREDSLSFRIVRGYDVGRMAERPLALMPELGEAEDLEVVWQEVPGGPLPIHVVRTGGVHRFHVAAYLFVLGNQPVRSPALAQFGRVSDSIRVGREPLTVFLAGGGALREDADAARARVVAWIEGAWGHYRRSCVRPPEGGVARSAP